MEFNLSAVIGFVGISPKRHNTPPFADGAIQSTTTTLDAHIFLAQNVASSQFIAFLHLISPTHTHTIGTNRRFAVRR